MDYREADKAAQAEFVREDDQPVLTAKVYYTNGKTDARDFTALDTDARDGMPFDRMIKWLAAQPYGLQVTVWEDGARVEPQIITECVNKQRYASSRGYGPHPAQGTILCADRFSFPVEDELADYGSRRLDCAALLVAGGAGDYAVYVGSGSDDFIRRKGRKLTFVQAQQHFAGLEESRYRR